MDSVKLFSFIFYGGTPLTRDAIRAAKVPLTIIATSVALGCLWFATCVVYIVAVHSPLPLKLLPAGEAQFMVDRGPDAAKYVTQPSIDLLNTMTLTQRQFAERDFEGIMATLVVFFVAMLWAGLEIGQFTEQRAKQQRSSRH